LILLNRIQVLRSILIYLYPSHRFCMASRSQDFYKRPITVWMNALTFLLFPSAHLLQVTGYWIVRLSLPLPSRANNPQPPPNFSLFLQSWYFLFRRLNTHFDHLTSTPSVFHSSRKMHWDRTVARTLLIFSVTNIALAAPAVARPTHISVAKVAPEKRLLDDEATDGSDPGSDHYFSASEPMPELVSDSDSSRYLSASTDSGSDRHFSPSESLDDSSPSGSSHDDWPPASPAASYHEGSVFPLRTNRYFITPVQFYRVHDELEDSAPQSSDGSSHPDPALASPAGSLHQDSADSAPEMPPSGLLHQDASAIPSSQPSGSLHQDAASAPDLEPSDSLNQDVMPDSQPPASLHQNVTPDLEPPSSLHQDATPDLQPSGLLHQDVTPDLEPSGSLHQDATPELQPSGLLHQDAMSYSQPSASLHQDVTPDLQPSGSLHQDVTPDFEPSGSLHQDATPDLQPSGLLHQDAMPDSQPSGPLHQDSVPGSPLHDTFSTTH
jgi:hypothetical protein